jgi:site-specific recombinase XerD
MDARAAAALSLFKREGLPVEVLDDWRIMRDCPYPAVGAWLSAAGYQRMVARAGVAAKFTFLVHSHMLRHACGFKLANDGHDTRAIQAYLGHRSIMSTVRYTALTPNRFKHFWKD